MKLAIIAAMEQEMEAICQHIEQPKLNRIHHLKTTTGEIKAKQGQHDILAVESGIGKVNASIATTLIIDAFKPDFVINTGSAGGADSHIETGDVVIATKVCYHDVDVRAFDYDIGQVPRMPKHYFSDKGLMDLTHQLDRNALNHKIYYGDMLSGDSFINDSEKLAHIKTLFPDCKAIDMEACAIAQTCYTFNTSFIIVRSISDHANQQSAISFKEFLAIAANNSATIIKAISENLAN